MEFRRKRVGEREEVLDLLEAAFSERELFERYMEFDPLYSPDDFLLGLEGGRIVSCVQLFSRRIRLGEGEVALGGIGSVATHPDFRGRGTASALMREVHQEMGARGMAIGLLFTGRFTFYEPLGWQRTPVRSFALSRVPAGLRLPSGTSSREFREEDLAGVRRIYDRYNAGRTGTTVRDAAYWQGQLRYAGTPGERFRVALRGDRLVAYARMVDFESRSTLMEYGREDDAADDAAALIAEACPPGGRLVGDEAHDPGLAAAFGALGARFTTRVRLGGAMWRVVDRPLLARLSGVTASSEDSRLIDSLVGTPPAHYWLSDRF